MKTLLKIVSYVALVLLAWAPVSVLLGKAGLEQAKTLMLITTIIWLVATPFWMDRTG